MRPKAIRKDGMVRGTDGLLRLEIVEEGREYVLDPFAELIWDLSDGSHTIETLAEAAGRTYQREVRREEVFSALDFLADAGLLEERVTPPVAEANASSVTNASSVSRRVLLARIAPVIGAAWMISGTKAGGLMQWSESNSKEDSNKAAARESNTKADNREISNKESDRKGDDRERDGKRDWDRQQDAEKGRKRDTKATFDRINESESKRSAYLNNLQQKMRTSWPKLYNVVGHKLSEFPELLKAWQVATRLNPTLTSSNYDKLFQSSVKSFKFQLLLSVPALTVFSRAGFDVGLDSIGSGPLLPGDAEKKTFLVLEQIANPAFEDNWRYALSPDNLRIQFNDPEAAYQFLSTRARGAQKR